MALKLPDEMRILILEDNRGHARLIDIFLAEAGFDNERIFHSTGEETHTFLFGDNGFVSSPRPGSLLLLLDLNLPGITGRDILKQMRATPETSDLPVIVVTSSIDPEEEERCRQMGANGFILKPPSPRALQETFREVGLASE